MNTVIFIIVLNIVYLIAAIPTGIVLAKVMGYEDVRDKGSGNIGATNVYRVAGKLPGILTLVGDILKGLLPLLAIKLWLDPSAFQLGAASLVAIVGHCYPVYLKFKGGKGVATALGIFLALCPGAVLVAAVIFVVTVAISRYISLGSVLAALSVPVLMLAFGKPQAIFISSLCIGLLIVWRHRSNISRILDGTESRFKA
jgi:glycerol-3-phosphate acyltransferase PlsY